MELTTSEEPRHKEKAQIVIIAEGWINLFLQPPEIKAMARERAAICGECFDDDGKPMICYDKLLHLYKHCRACKCHASALLFSPDKRCLLGKW